VGCMAGCGHGPNVAMDPPGVVLNHMATPARFRDAISAVGGVDIPPKALKATELRLAGNAAAREGDLQAAVANYTEASLPTAAIIIRLSSLHRCFSDGSRCSIPADWLRLSCHNYQRSPPTCWLASCASCATARSRCSRVCTPGHAALCGAGPGAWSAQR